MKLVENWSQATYNMPAARDARSVSKSFPRPKAKICLGLWNLDTIYETSRTAQATKWSETVEKDQTEGHGQGSEGGPSGIGFDWLIDGLIYWLIDKFTHLYM